MSDMKDKLIGDRVYSYAVLLYSRGVLSWHRLAVPAVLRPSAVLTHAPLRFTGSASEHVYGKGKCT